jgi:hypothetical protein
MAYRHKGLKKLRKKGRMLLKKSQQRANLKVQKDHMFHTNNKHH